MKKNVVRILTAMLMLSMVFSSSVFAAEKTTAWDSFVGLFAGSATTAEDTQVGGVTYRTHIQNEGWAQGWVQDGAMSGSVGKGLRLEGIEIKLQGDQLPDGLGITYRTHIQNEGWAQGWVEDGEMSGSEGKGLRLEGIEIKLTGDNAADYSVEYQTQIENEGWAQGWVKDGEMSGSSGKGLRLEAIEIKIVQVEADLTAYTEALEAVNEEDYTPASWAAYQEVVLANVMTTADLQSEVDSATAAIVAAQENLVELGKVTGLVAINATTVEVTLSEAVTEIDKADFAIEGLDVTNAAIKQTDNKVVVLTTAAQVGGQVYKVSYQGVDTGLTFTGISAVLPTAIKIADGTNFVQVGQEFTVTATVTTADANKAGIPVTFNIDAPSGSLNQDIIAERYTNADGVAEYKYTRYATDNDFVAVYPTGAAAVRDTRTISWSAQPLLSVTTSEANVIANDGTKTYTVTVRNQATGNVVSGETVEVLFNENIGSVNGSTAKATDVSNGNTKTPSQRATGDADTLVLTTNASGTATFSVTGANTTATPIVFIDAAPASNRLDAGDKQLWAPAVTFQGAQLTDMITVTPETEATIAADGSRGRVYTIDVNKADGTAFAGGVVQVAFNELIDSNLGTDTDATFVWYDNDSTLRTTTSNGVVAGVQAPVIPWPFADQMVISLNNDGQATFMIANASPAQVATPIVWIDQDSTTSTTNHVLENTEPRDLGGVTITAGKTAQSAKLSADRTSQAVGTTAAIKYSVLDQNGGEYLPAADGDVRVTYTIQNTGANALTVTTLGGDNVLAGSWSVNGSANGAFPGLTINPSMSATVAATLQNTLLIPNPNTNTLIGLNSFAGPTSYSISAQGLTLLTNKSLPAAAITGTFVNEVNVDAITIVAGQSVTGTITEFDTADADYVGATVANAQSGKVVIAVDGQPGQYAFFTYNKGLNGVQIGTSPDDNLFVGNDANFNNNSAASNAQFESALSVGNKVRIIANGGNNQAVVNNISLYNVNSTNSASQINQTLPVPPGNIGVWASNVAVTEGLAAYAPVQATGTIGFPVPAVTVAPVKATTTIAYGVATGGTVTITDTAAVAHVFTWDVAVNSASTFKDVDQLALLINGLADVDASVTAPGVITITAAQAETLTYDGIGIVSTDAAIVVADATLGATTAGVTAVAPTTITVDGITFTCATVATPSTFTLAGGAAGLAATINAQVPSVDAVVSGTDIIVTADPAVALGAAGNTIALTVGGDGTTTVSGTGTLAGGMNAQIGVTESGTITVQTGASATGTINVVVNGTSYPVNVVAGDSANAVALAIRTQLPIGIGAITGGYTVGGALDAVTFTSSTPNTPITPNITVVIPFN